MTHLALEIDTQWEITTKYGVYNVEVNEVSDYKGGSVSGHYTYHGSYIGLGCFPLTDITKMVKI